MAASTNPVFVDTPKTWVGRLTTTNTNRDGTGTIVTVATGGADGSLIEGIEAIAEGATTPGYINLFLSTDSGATWRFWRSIGPFSTATPSATVDAWQSYLAQQFLPLALSGATQLLGAASTLAGNFVVVARGGDF